MVPGFTTAPYNDIDAAVSAITEQTCGVIVETIQGEGGVNVATPEFLQALRRRCDEVDALLIYDEIQCGMGRTGSLWACDHPGIPPPDIITSAKALGNGFPVGATIVSEKVANAIQVGDHGTTFGGNPVACRVACHVLERISKPGFLDEVIRKGEVYRQYFTKLQARYPDFIKEIRGKGLMLGVQLTPEAELTKLITAARERGLLIISCGTDTLRIVPPLIIEDGEIERGMRILEAAMEATWVQGLDEGKEGTDGQQEMRDNPALKTASAGAA